MGVFIPGFLLCFVGLVSSFDVWEFEVSVSDGVSCALAIGVFLFRGMMLCWLLLYNDFCWLYEVSLEFVVFFLRRDTLLERIVRECLSLKNVNLESLSHLTVGQRIHSSL